MLKKFTALLLTSAILLAAVSCAPGPAANTAGKISVSVTFDALREFTSAVGGDKVAVSVIIPEGTEPHDFEPKAQDLKDLSKAQLFIINGFGMEPWAEDAVKAAGNAALITVDASAGVEPIANTDGEGRGQNDPHIWLSLKSAQTEVKNICNALIKADPGSKALYETNCSNYIGQLETLYSGYSSKFAALQNRNFVTGHAAFAYLCRDFGLTQNSVEDVFAEGEPSAQQMASLIDYCKSNKVTTVFSEMLMSSGIADTLAREVGAKVVPIYTIESGENGKSYLQRMDENLKVIYESLK